MAIRARALVIVALAAVALVTLTLNLMPLFLPTQVPETEYSGFYPPAATGLYLGYVGLCLVFLAWLWRRQAGPARRPVLEAVAMALLFLLAMEGATRYFLERLPRSAYAPHPLLRWDLTSYQRSLRGDRTPAPPHQPGEYRILVLGDSATYGVGVELPEAWPLQLQAALPGATVINHGVPGYTTFQAMGWLEREGLALEPDLVILASSHNDYQDAVTPDRDWIGGTPWARSVRRLLMEPALAQVVRAMTLPGHRDPGFPAHIAPGFRVPLQDRRAVLDRVRELCRERGVPLVLVVMPQALYPWPATDYMVDLRKYAKEHDLPLADAFVAYVAAPAGTFPADSPIHPSPAGHALIGRTVADTLRKHGLHRPQDAAASSGVTE